MNTIQQEPEFTNSLPESLKKYAKEAWDKLKIISFIKDGKTIYSINFFEISTINYLQSCIEINRFPLIDFINNIKDQYMFSSLSPRFFQVEFDEIPSINFTTKKSTFAGYKIKEDEFAINLLSQEEYANLVNAPEIGSTAYPEYFAKIEDENDRKYVSSKIAAKYVQHNTIEKFDYDMKIRIFKDIYDVIEDQFTVTNPCIVYKDGDAKVKPGSSKVYFFLEDLLYQLKKNIDEVNLLLKEKKVFVNIYSKTPFGSYEEASYRDYNVYDSKNHAKNFIQNTVLILGKLPGYYEDDDQSILDTNTRTTEFKSANEAKNHRDRSRVGIVGIFENRIKSNINLIQLSLSELVQLKLLTFEKKEDQKYFDSLFKSINPIHNIAYVNKPDYNYRELMKLIAEKAVKVFVNTYIDTSKEIENEKQFKKELEDLSTVISKIEYIAASQNISFYSSSTESINLQVPVGNIVQLIRCFPRIKKYIEQKEIK